MRSQRYKRRRAHYPVVHHDLGHWHIGFADYVYIDLKYKDKHYDYYHLRISRHTWRFASQYDKDNFIFSNMVEYIDRCPCIYPMIKNVEKV